MRTYDPAEERRILEAILELPCVAGDTRAFIDDWLGNNGKYVGASMVDDYSQLLLTDKGKEDIQATRAKAFSGLSRIDQIINSYWAQLVEAKVV